MFLKIVFGINKFGQKYKGLNEKSERESLLQIQTILFKNWSRVVKITRALLTLNSFASFGCCQSMSCLGACTNHVDRILGNFDPAPPPMYLDIFYWIVLIKYCGHLSNPPPPSFVHVVCTCPKHYFWGYPVFRYKFLS